MTEQPDDLPADVVDLARVEAWMDATGLGSGPLRDIERLAGGTQNVLLRFQRGDRLYVLRRPPPHKRSNSDVTMQREARVLAALAGTDVPHPGLIAACDDMDVIGAVFYLMEPVAGFNPTTVLPGPFATDPVWQHRMGLAMAEGIGALARVDTAAAGLEDLGRPGDWLARQVERWRSHLASYADFGAYPGPDIPGVERVARWLDAHRPARWRPGLIHGDFHFANVIFRHEAPELAAIVDWELTTIGDPLLDLGHLVATWPANQAGVALPAQAVPGLPGTEEIVTRYGEVSGLPVVDALWYQVLACYRLGIILEGTHARACAGMAPVETGDRLHATTVRLFEQANDLVS